MLSEYVSRIDGSRLWADQLDDDRFLPLVEQELKKAESSKPPRPPLHGYSREVDAMFRVATELRLLRAEMGKWGAAPPILGPVFPGEKLKALQDAHEVDDLAAAIAVGHQNWREATDRARI